MHHVTLAISGKDRMLLTEAGVDIEYTKSLMVMILNTIKPTSKQRRHRLKVCVVGEEYSYYSFHNTIHISQHVLNLPSRHKRVNKFLEDLLHELGHFIQFKIDHVPLTKFIVDVESVSYTKYFNNSTERQARKYGNVAKEAVLLHNKLHKLRLSSTSLNTQDDQDKKNKKSQA